MLNEMVVEADRGQFKGTSTTFGQLCERWLELAKSDLSPITVRVYENLLKNHILPALGDVPVNTIKSIDLDRLYLGLQHRKDLSSNTVRHIHAVIRRALRQAVLWGWIAMNPAANATQPRLIKPELSPPDVSQVVELLQAAKELDPELGHFLHLAATTGARRGELCALRWSNIDTSLRTITIEHSILEVPGGVLEKDTKTHASRRIALDDGTLAILEVQRNFAMARASTVGLGVDDDAYVFSREPDGHIPWTPGAATKRFSIVRETLGFEEIRLHDLRHFAATRLIAAGVPVRTVSGRLGHANPSTTLSVYSHFVEASDQEAANVMGLLVTKADTPRTTKRNVAVSGKNVKTATKKNPTKRSASVRSR
jgi:integrase